MSPARRPRPTVAALVAATVGVGTLGGAWAAQAGEAPPSVVVSSASGQVLARVDLPGERFAVRYRNSIYGTLAEERYAVTPDGRFVLDELAADQLAVLEEYYAVDAGPRSATAGDRRAFVAEPHPDRTPAFRELSIAATDLGERTLFVPGRSPVALWRLVGAEAPTVVLRLDGVS